MAPAPQDCPEFMSSDSETPHENAIVISGMSTLMPDSRNIVEFAEKLYNKENFVKHGQSRWNYTHPELSEYYGRIPELTRFDAQFFMVHYRLGIQMDAMARKLLEQVYHAIYDAGYSPTELSGTRLGVYVFSTTCETEKECNYKDSSISLMAVNRAMFANRISYWLNAKGPSIVLDASCCSSMVAMEKAQQALQQGDCDSAIVGGGAVLLHPHSSIHYNRLVPTNTDGKTKSFDTNADGQTRSEAVNVVFLQKFKDAKRVYALVRQVKTQFALNVDEKFGLKFGPYREPDVLAEFFRKFYEEAGVSPASVEYVEGFGSAVQEADKSELQAIESVFCKNRNDQLMIGSIMSNIGYTEAACGTSSLIKVLLGYHKGKLAANLHCDNPRQDIESLRDGRMRVITDNESFSRSYVGINCLSVTGINAHMLLQGYFKPKDLSKYQSEIPCLVIVSGRQESSVQKILDDLKGRPLDPEEIALLQSIHKMRIKYHLSRGFGVYSTDENKNAIAISEKLDYYDDAKAPLWFVYSGVGSQWTGMGAKLMKIPIFRAAVERCQKFLEPKGIDLVHILTSDDDTIFANILNSFVGIAAIQIGLTDVLRAIGLIPDKIIGHSVGELGCAYADGCFTAEEMILAAYSRGLVSVETPFIRGSMAAVGVGYTQLSTMCPPEIEIACHNGPESSTISGSADAMREFVAKLTAQGIFAKEVLCSNIAFHSRYIAEAGPGLLKYLGEVIKTPKPRSERWVSTSVPQERWNESSAKYSSAEYHTNNLLNPVLFEETSRLVPSNAVLVEIAPHGLLQAILKRSLPPTCQHIPLTRRGHADSALFLLEAIGKIYMAGYDVDISALYPKIEFPVSTETRTLSHLPEWAHGETWPVCLFKPVERIHSAVYKPIITIYDDEYLRGNVIEGTRLFPFAGTLVAVWDTLAMSVGKPKRELSVKFRDINLQVQPPLYDQQPLKLRVTLQRGSGRFEVTYKQGLIADGYIVAMNPDIPQSAAKTQVNGDPVELKSTDIYKLLHERGYQYSGDFRSIHTSNLSLTRALLNWNQNWVTLIDGLLQLASLKRDHTAISLPKYIKQLSIDMKNHWKDRTCPENSKLMEAEIDEVLNTIRCNCLSIQHINFNDKPHQRQITDLKSLHFFRYFQEENSDIYTTLYVYMQIIAENLNKNDVKVVDVHSPNKPSLLDKIKNLLNSPPEVKIDMMRMSEDDIVKDKAIIPEADVVLVHNLLSDKQFLEALYRVLPSDTFIICLGDTQNLCGSALYRPVCSIGKGHTRIELARWKPLPIAPTSAAVSIRSSSDLTQLRAARNNFRANNRLLVMTDYPPKREVVNLVKQWRREKERNNVYMMMIKNNVEKEHDLEDLPSLELAFNVLDQGQWGGEYYLPLQEENSSERLMTLQSKQLGDVNSLHWVEASPIIGPGIPVTVHFTGLSVYDARRARAEVPITRSSVDGYGMDFSGLTERGDRVMGLIKGGAASSKVMALPELIWPVPSHWTLEDAATVPLPYAHAFYCLGIKTRIRRGMNILIHGGVGALGQAAISIALAMGCKVFTTVGDIHKKRFLRQLFPDLPADHIGNSRDNTFGDVVLSATQGEGCQIIISCVKGDLKNTTLHCVAHSGSALDTEQIYTQENYTYGLWYMTKSRSYEPIDFSSIFTHQKTDEMKELQLMISEGIARGYVRPLSRVEYAAHEAARAFRLLAASRHRGRAILRMRDHEPLAHTTLICSSNLNHLLLCNDDGFGVKFADRLVSRGARKLHINCLQSSPYLQFKIKSWQTLGVNVQVSSENLNNKETVLSLLKNSNLSGPLEGIYVIATELVNDESRAKLLSTLTILDVESRKLRPSLKYFAIISDEHLIGREICLDRNQFNLPSLSLQLHNLEKFDEEGKISTYSVERNSLQFKSALDAAERALRSKYPVALGYAQPQLRQGLFEEVAKIPGVSISSSTLDRSTLEQVGIDCGRAQEVCNLLQEKFNIMLQKDGVPQMTIAELKALQEDPIDLQKEVAGFEAYFNYIDSDELLATSELVFMQTLVQSSKLRSDEFAMKETYMCVVPGMEGHHRRLATVCARLRLPAAVLQLGLDRVAESVSDTARRLVHVMMKKLNIKDHFYLLGYEFGVLIALEMAAILESYGLTGTVYLLGGTPDDIRKSVESNLHYSETELQNSLIIYMYTLMTGRPSGELDRKLQDASTWNEKVVACLRTLRGRVPYSNYYTQALIEAAYARVQLIRQYKAEPRALRSNIILLRAALQAPLNAETLQCSSQRPVVAYELNASLAHVTKDLCCSTLINKHLQPEILEAFNNRNHSETYLLNGEMYLEMTCEDQ